MNPNQTIFIKENNNENIIVKNISEKINYIPNNNIQDKIFLENNEIDKILEVGELKNIDNLSSQKKKIKIVDNSVNNIVIEKDINTDSETFTFELINKYNNILKKLISVDSTALKLFQEIKELKNEIKNFEKPLLKNQNKLGKKKNTKNNDWGFFEKRDIPISIKLFFNLDKNVKLSRTEIGGLFQNYIEKNNLKGNLNLKNKMDKRIYKIDSALSKLFGINQDQENIINSAKSSKIKYPDGFNFYNYQTWIKKIYSEQDNKIYSEQEKNLGDKS